MTGRDAIHLNKACTQMLMANLICGAQHCDCSAGVYSIYSSTILSQPYFKVNNSHTEKYGSAVPECHLSLHITQLECVKKDG